MREDDLRESSNVDRLSRAAWCAVLPDTFPLGSADQRVRWLATGFQTGAIAGCNTFESIGL